MSDSIDARRALHDAFFQDRDQELLDFLDEQAVTEHRRDAKNCESLPKSTTQ